MRNAFIDLESGKAICDFTADKLSVMEFACSPDGKSMASGGYDKEERTPMHACGM